MLLHSNSQMHTCLMIYKFACGLLRAALSLMYAGGAGAGPIRSAYRNYAPTPVLIPARAADYSGVRAHTHVAVGPPPLCAYSGRAMQSPPPMRTTQRGDAAEQPLLWSLEAQQDQLETQRRCDAMAAARVSVVRQHDVFKRRLLAEHRQHVLALREADPNLETAFIQMENARHVAAKNEAQQMFHDAIAPHVAEYRWLRPGYTNDTELPLDMQYHTEGHIDKPVRELQQEWSWGLSI